MRCGGGGIDNADFEADLADLGAAGDLPLAAGPALGGGALAAAAVAKAAALLRLAALAPDTIMPLGGAWYRWLRRHSAASGAVTAAAACRCAAARRANEISIGACQISPEDETAWTDASAELSEKSASVEDSATATVAFTVAVTAAACDVHQTNYIAATSRCCGCFFAWRRAVQIRHPSSQCARDQPPLSTKNKDEWRKRYPIYRVFN